MSKAAAKTKARPLAAVVDELYATPRGTLRAPAQS